MRQLRKSRVDAVRQWPGESGRKWGGFPIKTKEFNLGEEKTTSKTLRSGAVCREPNRVPPIRASKWKNYQRKRKGQKIWFENGRTAFDRVFIRALCRKAARTRKRPKTKDKNLPGKLKECAQGKEKGRKKKSCLLT